MFAVLLQSRPRRALFGGHSPPLMEQGPSLRLPLFPLLLKVLLKIKRKKSKCHSDCSYLPKRDVEPLTVTTGSVSTDHSSTHSLSPLAERRMYSPSQPMYTPAQSLASSWFQHIDRSFSEEIQEVLLYSRKLTARHTYLQKWTRFQIWCILEELPDMDYSTTSLRLFSDS